jgi:hypothetical protein
MRMPGTRLGDVVQIEDRPAEQAHSGEWLGVGGRKWTGARPAMVDSRQRGQARVVLAATPARNCGRARVGVRIRLRLGLGGLGRFQQAP